MFFHPWKKEMVQQKKSILASIFPSDLQMSQKHSKDFARSMAKWTRLLACFFTVLLQYKHSRRVSSWKKSCEATFTMFMHTLFNTNLTFFRFILPMFLVNILLIERKKKKQAAVNMNYLMSCLRMLATSTVLSTLLFFIAESIFSNVVMLGLTYTIIFPFIHEIVPP